jgi:3-oxoacyl-[acyl-carrier protein] reductase
LTYSLATRTALVTGANHGIGAATASALAGLGANVFITFYRPARGYSDQELEDARRRAVGGRVLYEANQQSTPDTVLRDVASHGVKAAAEEIDLANADDIPVLFDLCEQKLGRVDILVINHTHCDLDTFDPSSVRTGKDVQPDQLLSTFAIGLTTIEVIDRHLIVNARAAALLMRDYLQRHIGRRATWGRLISLTTVFAHPSAISYAASKRALVSYTQTAAGEMGKYGITANVVCPGPTQTGYITPDDETRLIAQTPLGRLGRPDDIADVVAFLASEQGRWITGQVIYAGGGFMAYPQ